MHTIGVKTFGMTSKWPQDTPVPHTMAKRLEAVRQIHGLSQNKLAKLSKCTVGTIQQIENGKTRTLKAENAFRISDALGISARWLIWGTGTIEKWQQLTPEEHEILAVYRRLPPAMQDPARAALTGLLAASAAPSVANPWPSKPSASKARK